MIERNIKIIFARNHDSLRRFCFREKLTPKFVPICDWDDWHKLKGLNPMECILYLADDPMWIEERMGRPSFLDTVEYIGVMYGRGMVFADESQRHDLEWLIAQIYDKA